MTRGRGRNDRIRRPIKGQHKTFTTTTSYILLEINPLTNDQMELWYNMFGNSMNSNNSSSFFVFFTQAGNTFSTLFFYE